MPSLQHQWLVLWAARKMERDGFVVTNLDGPTPQGGLLNDLPPPDPLGGYRPDVSGVFPGSTTWAIGEAKSRDDVDTDHTRRQLALFAGFRIGGALARLYVAVPLSAEEALERVLGVLGLSTCSRLRRILIPDCLVVERDNQHVRA